MAEGRSYGDRLRDARERQGIDLVSMARALHIRPDIVRAIESADFRKMPAHGYSKNMVRAYARKVGLDEEAISSQYLAEREQGESGGAQRSRRPSRSDRPAPARSRSISLDDAGRDRRARTERGHTTSFDASRRLPRERSQALPDAPRGSRRSKPSFPGGLPSFGSSSHRDARVGHSFIQADMASGLGGQSHPSRGSSFSLAGLNLPVVLGVVVAAVVLIIVAVVLFNGGKQSVDDVPDIPISGLTDTSDANGSVPAPVETAPTSAIFSFSVADGQESWVQVYMDGNKTPVYAAVAEGPFSQDFEVTGTLTFETANITPITLTLDGEEVKASPAKTGTNYTYVVDFPAILAQWKQEHDSGDDDASSSSAASSSDASSAAASGNSSSSARAS